MFNQQSQPGTHFDVLSADGKWIVEDAAGSAIFDSRDEALRAAREAASTRSHTFGEIARVRIGAYGRWFEDSCFG